jgi:hypothetical protein
MDKSISKYYITKWATLSSIRQNFIQQLLEKILIKKKKGVLSEGKQVQLQSLLSELEIINRNDGDDEILDKVKKIFVDLFETLEKNDFLYTYFCVTAGIAAFDFTNPDFVSFLTSGILPPSCTSHDPSTSYCLNRYLKIGEPFILQQEIVNVIQNKSLNRTWCGW